MGVWGGWSGGRGLGTAGMAERHLQVDALIDTNVAVLGVAMATAMSGVAGCGARSLHF